MSNDLQRIKDEESKDFQLDYSDLDKIKLFNINIPYLHHKYLMKYREQQSVVTHLSERKHKYYHEARLYYLGKADPEIYKEKPLDNTILKSDVDTWVKADERYSHVLQQLSSAESILDYYKRIVDSIPFYSNLVKNHLDILKFENGI